MSLAEHDDGGVGAEVPTLGGFVALMLDDMQKLRKSRLMPAFLLVLLLVLLQVVPALAERWAFAVTSDSRHEFGDYRPVLEQIKSNKPSDPRFPPAEFMAAIGDLDPVAENVRLFRDVFGRHFPYVPVRGNHEMPVDVRYILDKLLPSLASPKHPVVSFDKTSVTYHWDWKNIRFIAIDDYAPYARSLRDAAFLEWVEKAIVSAKKADHVFLAFHEPYVPDWSGADPFWGMLLRHSDKVRAVFCAHTHIHTRRYFPDNRGGGVYLVNSGTSGQRGHSDGRLTIVEVSVDKKDVLFRSIQAPQETRSFKVTDHWKASTSGE